MVFLAGPKLFSFMISQVSVAGLKSLVSRALLTESLSTPVSCRELPGFSSGSFGESGFRLKPLTQLDLIFVEDDVPNLTLLHVDLQFPRHHLLEVLPILQCFCLW